MWVTIRNYEPQWVHDYEPQWVHDLGAALGPAVEQELGQRA